MSCSLLDYWDSSRHVQVLNKHLADKGVKSMQCRLRALGTGNYNPDGLALVRNFRGQTQR